MPDGQARLPPLAARVVGVDAVPRPLVPLLAVNTLGTIAFSTFFAFVVVWATDRLGASGGALGLTFLIGAIASAVAGALGGALSDRMGRRPVILIGWGFEACAALVALAIGDHLLLGLVAMVVMNALGSLGQGADLALVADLVPPEDRERAYAAVRLCSNLGAVLGPVMGAGALWLGGWNLFFGVAAAFGLGAFVAAARFLPAGGSYTPERAPADERPSLWIVLRDGPFVLFWVAGLLSFMVYTAYEILLSRSLISDHGYPTWAWGLITAINPVLVVVFQMRVTAWAGRRGRPGLQLAVAMLLMGLPFLVLLGSSAVPVVVGVVVVFVIGEMLWAPTGQALAERMSPDDLRGSYMGAYGATGAVAFALGPFIGLNVHEQAGEGAMWAAVAGFAIAGALIVLAVVARVGARLEPRPPLPDEQRVEPALEAV